MYMPSINFILNEQEHTIIQTPRRKHAHMHSKEEASKEIANEQIRMNEEKNRTYNEILFRCHR
jgi:hypothetical protein